MLSFKKVWHNLNQKAKDLLHSRVVSRFISNLSRKKYLWRIEKQGLAKGAAIGAFWAFIPMPLQMLPSAFHCVAWRANLPIAVGFVWISNPVTWAPIYFFCYKVGAAILDYPKFQAWGVDHAFDFFQMSTDVLIPLFTGSLLVAIVSSACVYFLFLALPIKRRFLAATKRSKSTKTSYFK